MRTKSSFGGIVPTMSSGSWDRRHPSASNGQHFAAGHLLTRLKKRAVSSGFITVFAQGVHFVLNLASVVVLARRFMPQDFGLLAKVTTITGFLDKVMFHSHHRKAAWH